MSALWFALGFVACLIVLALALLTRSIARYRRVSVPAFEPVKVVRESRQTREDAARLQRRLWLTEPLSMRKEITEEVERGRLGWRLRVFHAITGEECIYWPVRYEGGHLAVHHVDDYSTRWHHVADNPGEHHDLGYRALDYTAGNWVSALRKDWDIEDRKTRVEFGLTEDQA